MTRSIRLFHIFSPYKGGCKCKDLVNRNRVGNCQGRKPSQFNGQHFTCYVHLPSNCSDLKSSTTNPGEKFSAEACFKKGIPLTIAHVLMNEN